MQTGPPPTKPVPAPPGLLCAKCQYELTGLPGAGVCPECGFSVIESLEAERKRLAALRPQAPVWLALGQVVHVLVFLLWLGSMVVDPAPSAAAAVLGGWIALGL